ncbi:MAG: VOC family protein [Mucilaginibacter sp.]
MTKELWINLPVKNLKNSMDFFTRIGFKFNTDSPGHNDTMSPMIIGAKNIVVMLIEEKVFTVNNCVPVSDTSKGSEVLLSFDAESREEVDEMAKKVVAAGGKMFSDPAEVQGWMYGCGFSDPDGHRWNMLYMDMSKMNG